MSADLDLGGALSNASGLGSGFAGGSWTTSALELG